MRRLPQNLGLLAVSVFTLAGLAVSPVFAQTDTTDATDSGSVTTTQTETPTPTETESHPGYSHHGRSGQAKSVTTTQSPTADDSTTGEMPGNLRAQAAKLLAQDRQNKKQSTLDHRQKACDAHQAELTTRQANYAKAAQRHLDTFTSIYNKVLDFQTIKQLNVSNFADLKAAVEAKQTAAQAAVTALSSSDVKVDCTATDPAASVAALKTAVANARTALQDYRTAIKDMVVALQGASTGTGSDTTESPAPTSTPAPTEAAQ